MNVKAEEAKKDLQKRSYSITEVRKIALIKKITNDLKEGKTSLLENESVLQRFGKFMSPKSTQKFIDESHDLAEMKKKFIDAAKIKGIYVPIDAAEAVRLAHTNYVKDYGGISSVQGNLSDVKNMLEKHKSFFPMIERALVEEKIALEKGRPVLYHGLSKIHYKFMYFLTKIMELAGLSYPGFLRIRGLSTYADPEKRLWLNNESFKRREFLRVLRSGLSVLKKD